MSSELFRSSILGLLLLPLAAAADYHFEANKQDAVAAEDQALAAEITAFLEEYAAAYNEQDYRTVKSMWLDDGNPIYMAEEVPFPLYGKERMDNYFNPVPGKRILDGIDNRYSEVRAKFVAPDIAIATYRPKIWAKCRSFSSNASTRSDSTLKTPITSSCSWSGTVSELAALWSPSR